MEDLQITKEVLHSKIVRMVGGAIGAENPALSIENWVATGKKAKEIMLNYERKITDKMKETGTLPHSLLELCSDPKKPEYCHVMRKVGHHTASLTPMQSILTDKRNYSDEEKLSIRLTALIMYKTMVEKQSLEEALQATIRNQDQSIRRTNNNFVKDDLKRLEGENIFNSNTKITTSNENISGMLGLKVRTDIFEDFAISVNTENIHKRKVAPVEVNNEEGELKIKENEENKNYSRPVEVKTEDSLENNEEWFNARRMILGLKNNENKKQKLHATEKVDINNLKDNSEVQKSITSTAIDIKTIKTGELLLGSSFKSDEKSSYDINQKMTSNSAQKKGNMMEKKRIAGDNTIKNTIHNLELVESQTSRTIKFSNHMKDAVKTECQVCKKIVTFRSMRSHTRLLHDTTITEYKKQHGDLKDHIIEAVYHKCGICDKAILLDSDVIAPHTRLHGISHKEYSLKYLILTQNIDSITQKESTDTSESAKAPKPTVQPKIFDLNSLKTKSSVEILMELEEMVAIT